MLSNDIEAKQKQTVKKAASCVKLWQPTIT